MKYSKKRDLKGVRTKTVNVKIPEKIHEKLNRIAGPESLGWTVEELVKREWARREKREAEKLAAKKLLTQQLRNSTGNGSQFPA